MFYPSSKSGSDGPNTRLDIKVDPISALKCYIKRGMIYINLTRGGLPPINRSSKTSFYSHPGLRP